MAGIKESLEALELLPKIAETIEAIYEDKKLDVRDLFRTETFSSLAAQAVSAAKDIQKVPEELADLDHEEVVQLISAVTSGLLAIAKAIKAAA